MTRKERVIRIVRAVLENKQKIHDDLEKDGRKNRAACYMREILQWSTFEMLLTDDRFLNKLERIYIEGNEE